MTHLGIITLTSDLVEQVHCYYGDIVDVVMTMLHPISSQSAGIVAGSLGALETLGKKTIDILSEGDPGEDTPLCNDIILCVTGFKKKRELLRGKTKTLSEVIVIIQLGENSSCRI